MRLIARSTLREFWELYPDAEAPLRDWERQTKAADWKSPADVKATFRSASILERGRVVFNIKGNYYRLVVRIHYNLGIVYVRFIGPHRDYDRIDATEI